MDKLKELLSKCKCGVYLSVNQHRDYYETVEKYFEDEEEWLEEIDPLVYEKMKQENTIVELQVYPNTPIGFIRIYHYDVESAIDIVLKELNIL
jgi:hypothetical protein